MKKVLFFLIVILVLGGAPVLAVDLQAGPYANLYCVRIWRYDMQHEPILTDNAWFVTSPGTYGPFQVFEPYGDQYARSVSVPVTAYGVPPGTSVELPLAFGYDVGEILAAVDVSWETNYDASTMRLQLWQRLDGVPDALLWSQDLSGRRGGGTHPWLAQDVVADGLFFKVSAIPEPCALFSLSVLSLAGIARARRRGR